MLNKTSYGVWHNYFHLLIVARSSSNLGTAILQTGMDGSRQVAQDRYRVSTGNNY